MSSPVLLCEATAADSFDPAAVRHVSVPHPTPAVLRAWLDAGVTTLIVSEDVDADDHAVAASFVAFLRDAATFDMQVRWRARGAFPRHALIHLPPPANDDAWQRTHDAEAFTWRHGPGFAQLYDQRGADAAVRLVIDDEHTLNAFHRLQTPSREPIAGVVGDLAAEGVVLAFGDWLVAVPRRKMRRGMMAR